MKKLLLLVLFASVALFAQAQKNNKTPEERAQAKTDRLAEKLALNDAQKEQVYALFLEQSTQRVDGKKMRDLSKEERAAFMEDRKAQRAAFDTNIREILNEEQYAIYQEKGSKSGKKEMRGGKGKGQRGGNKNPEERVDHKVNRLTEDLQLTNEQQAQVRALLTAQAANRPEKGAFKDLTDAEKAAAKEQRKAAKADFDASMQNILSADQYSAYSTAKQEKGGKGKRGKGANGKGNRGKGANGNRNSEEGIQKRVDKMTEQLQLTPAQQTELQALYTEHQAARPEKGAFKNMSEADRAAAKEARQNAKTELDTSLQAILSAEQYATYQQLKNARSGKRGKKGKGKNKE